MAVEKNGTKVDEWALLVCPMFRMSSFVMPKGHSTNKNSQHFRRHPRPISESGRLLRCCVWSQMSDLTILDGVSGNLTVSEGRGSCDRKR